MKVAIVTESFLPQVNGVTNSVCHILDHLAARGHEAIVVSPQPGPETYAGFPVHLVPALTLPFYRSFRLGLPSWRITSVLRNFRPDVVHLASPAFLGWAGAVAAGRLAIPSVAVYQTDYAGYGQRYNIGGLGPAVWALIRHIHRRAARTLAPSTATLAQLRERGIPQVALWGHGVDLERFHPRHRSESSRARLAPGGEVVVGYVGRLAREKQVHVLAELAGLEGVRLVIVGDGPLEARLRHLLPDAVFCGMRTGTELSRLYASFDIFVNTGTNETFCLAVQEALASGVPVVAAASGGPLDLVHPGRNGLLYPPDQPAGIRTAVESLARDPTERARMGAEARQSVLGRPWDALCDELLAHYRLVTGLPAVDDSPRTQGDGGVHA